MKQLLQQKIVKFMKEYDPAEFGDEQANGGETYANKFSEALVENLLSEDNFTLKVFRKD